MGACPGIVDGSAPRPPQRTVAVALRATGRADAPQFHRYHCVLSHARWSGLAVGRTLLGLLVATFVPEGPLVFGIDETLERRRGRRIAAKGIYRDAVRSSHAHFAKVSGLLCADQAATPAQILGWFVQRWQVEVTLEEVRRHLGVEPQRQWSDRAIRRTTPALLGLFSLVTLLAHERMTDHATAVRQAAWYRNERPTFANALALVRRELWHHEGFQTSPCTEEDRQTPARLRGTPDRGALPRRLIR